MIPVTLVDGIAFISNKVLLKLSSTLKLRNFDIGMKTMAVASHQLVCTARGGYSHIFWCGCYCFIRINGNAKTRL